MDAAHAIRKEVFVIGQNVPPEIEWDEFEESATHLICEIDGKIVGTGRISYFDKNKKVKVERVAVLEPYRNLGIGTEIVRFQIQEAKKVHHNQHGGEKDFFEIRYLSHFFLLKILMIFPFRAQLSLAKRMAIQEKC